MDHLFCKICNIQLNSQSQWDAHSAGSKHLQRSFSQALVMRCSPSSHPQQLQNVDPKTSIEKALAHDLRHCNFKGHNNFSQLSLEEKVQQLAPCFAFISFAQPIPPLLQLLEKSPDMDTK